MLGRSIPSARLPSREALKWLSVPAGVLAAGSILLVAPVDGEMATMLAITAFAICLWIGAPVPPWVTGLVCLGLIGVTASTELALTGFQSPATWLIVLGILLGEATQQSGLASLVERYVRDAAPAAATRDERVAYRYLLVALSATGLGLVVLIPSSVVRVLVLGPLLVSFGERFSSRRASIGVFLGPLFVTYYGGTGVLTGSLANIIITGIVESTAGLSIGWVEWAMWLGPVMAVGRAAVVVVCAYVLYRPRSAGDVSKTTDPESPTTGTTDARRMLLFLCVGVAIWATDTIHGLHPLYGAVVVTILAFLPRVGVTSPGVIEDVDFSILFFLGAIFAIAEGLQRTAFTDAAAQSVLSAVPDGAPMVVILGFVLVVTMALTFVMEGLAVASVLTPILVPFAASAGIPLLPVAMTEAIGLGTYFFPYQSAVLVAILGLDVVDSYELIRMACACSLATIVVLVPIQLGVFAVAF